MDKLFTQQQYTNNNNNSKRLAELEKHRDDCQQRLEDAQIVYTSSGNDRDILAERAGKTTKEIIMEQKQSVHDAAKALADAEEQLLLVGEADGGTRKSRIHQKAAHRILDLCRKNGGCYIKIGQHLANLDYLIPKEYIQVLSSLFDNTPSSSYSDVAKVIQEDLGAHPDQLFDSFQTEPIASASLAQVHVAYEKGTGKKIAIKVQHRGLRETSSGDLFALCSAVAAAEYLFQNDFTWGWIADEIAPQLPKELDFLNEGKNAERAAEYMKEAANNLDCVVPKIHWESSSSRVLCMDFEEGFNANDIEAIEKAGLKKK